MSWAQKGVRERDGLGWGVGYNSAAAAAAAPVVVLAAADCLHLWEAQPTPAKHASEIEISSHKPQNPPKNQAQAPKRPLILCRAP